MFVHEPVINDRAVHRVGVHQRTFHQVIQVAQNDQQLHHYLLATVMHLEIHLQHQD